MRSTSSPELYPARIHCRTLRKTIPHSLLSLMMTPMTPVTQTTSRRFPWFRRAALASKSFRHFCLMLQHSTSGLAASLDALASRVEDMSVGQVEEAAVRVVSESGHVRGLTEITNVFDKSEVALILACGVRRYQEYQALKGKREDKDIISYRQLQKKFGTNKRTLMEVVQGYKYRYPGGVSTKVPFTTTKPEEGEEAPATSKRPQRATPAQHKSLRDYHKILGPFRTTKPSQSRNIPQKGYP